jgi:hypothetical protein
MTGPGHIDVGKLPKTILDSMIVVKCLKLRYLWADSICIDQSSESAKQDQLQWMADIYRGAMATIIDVDGQNMDEGLPRIHEGSKRISQLRIDFGEGRSMLEIFPDLNEQLQDSPWMKRGWTFQEALLSRRRILFTAHQVYLYCNETECCESLHDEMSLNLDQEIEEEDESAIAVVKPSYQEELFRSIADLLRSEESDGGVLSKVDAFSHLVAGYLRRSLSHEDDILQALSAVLEEYREKFFRHGFWHGLPRLDFRRSLLWREQRPRHRVTDRIEQRDVEFHHAKRRSGKDKQLPSWSWTGWHLSSFNLPQLYCDPAPTVSNLCPPVHIAVRGGMKLFDNLAKTRRAWKQPRWFSQSKHRVKKRKRSITTSVAEEAHISLQIKALAFHLPCRLRYKPGHNDLVPDLDLPEFEGADDADFNLHSEWHLHSHEMFGDDGRLSKDVEFILLDLNHFQTNEAYGPIRCLVFELLLVHRAGDITIRSGTVSVVVGAPWIDQFLEMSRPRFKRICLE